MMLRRRFKQGVSDRLWSIEGIIELIDAMAPRHRSRAARQEEGSMIVFLQWVSIATAFMAAAFWLLSARVKIPPITVTLMLSDGSMKRPPHEKAWRDQSKFNALGALSAALASIAQGSSFYLTLP